MKALNPKTYFVQNLLTGMATACFVLAFFLQSKSIPFPQVLEISGEEVRGPIITGEMSLYFFLPFFAYVFHHLIFEFYGFKAALYRVFSGMIAVSSLFGLLVLLQKFALDPESSKLDLSIIELLVHSPQDLVIYLFAVMFGFGAAFTFAKFFKALTRNYLMFLRFPPAACLGLGIFLAISIYLKHFTELALESMMWDAVIPALQYALLILAAVVPLYFLRMTLGLFRGRAPKKKKDEDEYAAKRSVFKGAAKAKIPVQAKEEKKQPATQSTEQAPMVPEEEQKEDTVSQKVPLPEGLEEQKAPL
ncbi:MAG: hypothetical protein H7A33_06955 [Deltaproteobacteria bacterium]|nr:hypothetical protein [Deltaproteobacteria bacterium]